MKILYGVVGEGMGHAIRSQVILEHLAKSHEVLIVASGKAYSWLQPLFENVHKIEGFELKIDENKVDRSGSLAGLLKSLPKKSAVNLKKFAEISLKFNPQAVVSDFESFSYVFGRAHRIPVISIDNMQVINRCNIEVPAKHLEDYLVARGLVQGKLPGCYHYLITTFFFPEILKENTSLFPPILRKGILDTQTRNDGHILVYQTSTSNSALLKMLQSGSGRYIVYGYPDEGTDGQVTFRKFSEGGFIRDFAGAAGVIASSGFSLMGEALFLGKPYLAVPVQSQFEQTLNALYLEKLGYGICREALTEAALGEFTAGLEGFRNRLKGFQHDGNRGILEKLDSLLEEIKLRNSLAGV